METVTEMVVMYLMSGLIMWMCVLMTFVIPDYRSFNSEKRPPAFLLQLLRIVLGALYKSSARKDMDLPRVQVDLKGLDLKKKTKNYESYASLCGYYKDSKDLKVNQDVITQSSLGCYLEILSLPLQISIISDPQFPLQAFGLVHVKNTINQYRSINLDETLNLSAYVETQRWTDAGLEFDVVVIAYDQDITNPPWKCVATYISRSGKSGGKKSKENSNASTSSKDMTLIDQTFEISWDLPQNTGVKYANVSGDYNPFHLYPITAYPFGFPGPIAHGMYTLSRTIAEVTRSGLWIPQYPLVITAEFKRPLVLPAKKVSLLIHKLNSTPIESDNQNIAGLLPTNEERSNSKAVSVGVYSNKGVPHLKASFVVKN